MHTTRLSTVLPFVFVAAAACGGAATEPCPTVVDAVATEIPAVPAASPAVHENFHAVLWTQTAVEYATGTIQTYRLAELRLAEGLADTSFSAAPEQTEGFEDLPPAVIMDLDETVLDNSPYQAWLVASGQSFSSDTWDAWCEAEQAGAVPGALEFVRYAVDNGVTVFFVSNRGAAVEEATRANLEALGFGFALTDDFDNVLLKREQDDWGSAKGTRRIVVAETHRVVLSIGDNLGDFVDGYKVSTDERDAIMDANADAWGTRWIVLPNPQYGSWEGSLFGFDYALDRAAIDAAKLGALDAWQGPAQ